MLPVVAIVGRPNVGKSTLFNCLTGTRDALVADEEGLTRDRRYGFARLDARECLLVDTGGLAADGGEIARLIEVQATRALEEADAIVLVVDARDGLTASDEAIADRLRRTGKPVTVAANKTDGLDPDTAAGEFYALGFEAVVPVSAAHRRGLRPLAEAAVAALPEAEPAPAPAHAGVRIAIVGRPNVGKSTLVNRLVGEERVVAHDAPGTTRDSVHVPFERDGRHFTLIDTAGVRRRSRVTDRVERFSVVMSLRALAECNVAVAMIDAREGVTEQDASLIGLVIERGRALVVAVNKWDGLDGDARRAVRDDIDRKLRFAAFAPVHFVSALHGSGLAELLADVERCWRAASADLSAGELTRLLAAAVEHNPPPLVRGRRIKLRYAHQGGTNPPVVVVHGNQTELVPEQYRRYLAARFRDALGLRGTPLAIELRTGANPYQGRRNPLTPRQQRRRKRVIRHARKGRS